MFPLLTFARVGPNTICKPFFANALMLIRLNSSPGQMSALLTVTGPVSVCSCQSPASVIFSSLPPTVRQTRWITQRRALKEEDNVRGYTEDGFDKAMTSFSIQFHDS